MHVNLATRTVVFATRTGLLRDRNGVNSRRLFEHDWRCTKYIIALLAKQRLQKFRINGSAREGSSVAFDNEAKRRRKDQR